jgi:hypothetical protein
MLVFAHPITSFRPPGLKNGARRRRLAAPAE